MDSRISIPLRLTAGVGGETAELWVLRGGGMDEVEQLLRNSDDRLLARLLFAVGEANGTKTILLAAERSNAPKVRFTAAALDQLASDNAAQPTEASVYAAYLVSAAQGEQTPQHLVERLPLLARFLERQEPFLPVRTIWLAWQALTSLGGGDVLALARARDRLLQRLFQHGLGPELDMPGFLRVGSGAASERFRALREHVMRLQQEASRWTTPRLRRTPT